MNSFSKIHINEKKNIMSIHIYTGLTNYCKALSVTRFTIKQINTSLKQFQLKTDYTPHEGKLIAGLLNCIALVI